MKKTTLILTSLFLISTSYAQVRFGLKAGGNLANLDGFDQSQFDQSKMRLGINAGPILQINIAKLFFVQSELLYSLKGSKYEYSDSVISDHATTSLHYINLPVLFGYRAGKKISIKLGPEIGRLISARNETSKMDISGFYDKLDLGADLGLAYSFKKLSLDLRYNYGLKNLVHAFLTDPYGNPTGEEYLVTNRVLQFSLCYFIK